MSRFTKKIFLSVFSLSLLFATSSKETVSAKVPTSARSEKSQKAVHDRLVSELKQKGLAYGSPILLRLFKDPGEIEVWVETKDKAAKAGSYKLFKTYPICYFSGKPGPKQKVGDQQSPEGFYKVGPKQMNPYSKFHLSFDLGYPNAYDHAHGRTGSALMVHGNCVSIGCYAITDAQIEEIYALAEAALNNGQKEFWVYAFPFPLTEQNLEEKANGSIWIDFWKNLKEGYDIFEKTKRPLTISVKEKRYVFH